MRKPASTQTAGGARHRCAIYTRKSSEEGLEQAFNSLDAQREACDAYIRSQRHEGWVALPTPYDDGGISGGTLQRPALQQLLADIQGGRVDLVVVYKVDRLTRSLSDFAKIVEVFDAHDASFVSVTQQFNTTTSMGRLTLNMLLSFAQFEREVTGERIRDKIAASKRKGMWMGGSVPLGYDVRNRALVVNQAEAAVVRHIFRLYLTLGSVRLLQEQLAHEGVRSKLRPTATVEKMRGGKPFERGALYLILQNRLYLGEVRHKELCYPGQHGAIIDQLTWQQVQQRLEDNRTELRSGERARMPSLLAGLLHDAAGERLMATHAVKHKQRFRYYVSKALIGGAAKRDDGLRLPAKELEKLVWDRIGQLLSDPPRLLSSLQTVILDAKGQQQALGNARGLAHGWSDTTVHDRRSMLLKLRANVVATAQQVTVHLAPRHLAAALGVATSQSEDDQPPVVLRAPLVLKRVGYAVRLLVDGAGAKTEPNPQLIKLVVQAQQFQSQMLQQGLGIGELAAQAGVSSTYAARLLRLSCLAPDIVASILDGRQPAAMTANTLHRLETLPISWAAQRQALGFR